MSEPTLTVAAIQLCSQNDVEGNLGQCEAWVEKAAEAGAGLIVLPENFAFFGAGKERLGAAEPLLGAGPGPEASPIQSRLSGWARRYGAVVVGGGLPVQSGDPLRPFNTSVVFSADGALAAHYNKIHLFDVSLSDGTELRESAHTQPGSELVCHPMGQFNIGLSICYDLRFPELYRGLIDQGANVIVVSAAFTLHTGKDHWLPLLQARAIESQSWLVASAQWGLHPAGRRCYGHSLVIDPWGAVVAQCSDRPGVALATVDRDYLDQVRASVPSLQHRRL